MRKFKGGILEKCGGRWRFGWIKGFVYGLGVVRGFRMCIEMRLVCEKRENREVVYK
ncbi:unnamed protein product [Moneuplotes crassus]|uniref:Uncharacterized protein n=1 Tax=Euplotes crassus TaxID=5936 RepID=A0AAD1XS32_EUPCR|nr:unnamed protein product [Moneuplotes crassus]